MKNGAIKVLLIVTILVSFLCGGFIAYILLLSNGNSNVVLFNMNATIPLSEDNSISNSVDKIYDSTVVIEGFKDSRLVSTGTGFIYKEKGDNFYIATNHHVISGVDSVKVILSNSLEVDAKVIGSEAYSDIGVLSIKKNKDVKVAVIGDSTKLRVGDTLFAVGAPEGADYAGTVTKGILSGKDRLVAVALNGSEASDYYMKVIQTDVAINPGNSGGPLCNIDGEVIGITNMKLVDSSVEGIGFAIPIEDVLYYAAILETGKEIERPYLGISMLDINNDYYLWQNGINVPNGINSGVVVVQAVDNSPADKAGLEKGDIIIEMDGKSITSVAELRYELYKHKVGEKIDVKYVRNNKKYTTEVSLSKNEKEDK